MALFSKTAEYQVAPAINEDTRPMALLHAEGFDRPWSTTEITGLLSAKGTKAFVARMVGAPGKPPAGFIIFRQAADEAEILSIVTGKAFRRRNIGHQLVAETIRDLQADRIRRLFLEVASNNQPAINLYQSFGFDTVSRRENYYSSPKGANVAALVMRRALD